EGRESKKQSRGRGEVTAVWQGPAIPLVPLVTEPPVDFDMNQLRFCHRRAKLHVVVPRCQVWDVLLTDSRVRAAYAEGAGIYRIIPSAVAIPTSRDDVVRLVRDAAAKHLALIPRGAGRGMPGGNVGTGVIVGAEGTFAIVTEVHWRLDTIPAGLAGLGVGFADLDTMTEAVPFLVSLRPSAVELLDETLLRLLPEAPTVACLLLVEFERER